jgi:aquaporin Z
MQILREHWPEYLWEALGLAIIMLVSVGITVFAEVFLPHEWPHLLRRVVEGLAIAATVVALIYSPLGLRSGAHFNPAVTLTFLTLGRVKRADAAFYVASQFAGAVVGILVAGLLLGSLVREPPVVWIVTQPGMHGAAIAFAAEFAISFLLMEVVLVTGGSSNLSRFTGVFVGALVFLYVCFEAPISGFGMNPARSFASAAASGSWRAFWIYLSAPTAGMLSAALLNRSVPALPLMSCAKLVHDDAYRCIHCGFVPEQERHA